MGFLRAVLHYRIFFTLLFLMLLVAGYFALKRLPVDVYPDVPFNEATVTSIWPGATAKEVELLVTQKIEDEILTVPDIQRLRSRSSRDRSSINVKFDENLPPQQYQNRLQDLRAAVARVSNLPIDVEEPTVRSLTNWEVFPLCRVVVNAGEPGRPFLAGEEFQARQVARDLTSVLRDVPGVEKVDESFRDPEVHVNVSLEALWQLGYTIGEVADRLRYLNRDFSAGQLNLSSAQFILNTKGGLDNPEKLEELVLFTRADRTPVRLGDFAEVSRGFEEAIRRERFNRKPCVSLGVVKEGSADSVRLIAKIQERVDQFVAERSLPEQIEVALVLDTAQIIRSRISVLSRNLISGILLVGLLLWLTVGVRNALLALLGIPFSVLCALILFEPLGLSINAISLFSLVLVSGMVVDDAIVVLESIYQKIEKGLELREAILRGTWEVMGPVATSTLTTFSAFLPMLMMEGIVGQFFAVIPKTVVVTLIASLFECFLILPIHYLEFGPRSAKKKKKSASDDSESAEPTPGVIQRAADRVVRLNRVLIRRPLAILATAVLLVGGSMSVANLIPVQLFPSDFQLYTVTLKLPEGSTLDQSISAAVFAEDQIQQQIDRGDLQYTYTTVGLAWTSANILAISPDIAQINVFMHEDETDAVGLLEETRRLLDEALQQPGAPTYRSLVVSAPNDGPPVGKPIQLRLQVDDYAVGEALALRAMRFLETIPGVHSIERDLERGPLRVDLKILPEARALDGVDETRVGELFQAGNFGVRVGTFKDPKYGESYDLKVLLNLSDRSSLGDLLQAPLRHPTADELIPLSHFARLESRSSYKAHPHYSGRRSVSITADVNDSIVTGHQANELLQRWVVEEGIEAAAEKVTLGGEFEETGKSFDSMKRAFAIALLLIYLILATQFRSYLQPLVVMAAVPFSFIGVILGLLAMGIPFTITSFIAVVGLAGVVVNDTIVLIATINRFRAEEGMDDETSILEATRVRFRPILMTSLTTIIGLFPMAVGLGGFSKIWSPFAATMCFGLLSALTLIVIAVPSFVTIADSWRRQHRPNQREQHEQPASFR
ncbi:MAG: efflux RND transporter permease subunit [Planctomycetota bacterium]